MNQKKLNVFFIGLTITSLLFGLSTLAVKGVNALNKTPEPDHENNTPVDFNVPDEAESSQSNFHFSSYEEQEKYINEIMMGFEETAVVQKTQIVPATPLQKQSAQQIYSKQFIALSFDGSYSLSRWKDLTQFSEQQKILGTNIHFTFFISGVYFIPTKTKSLYTGPGHTQGRSDIGFGGTISEIKQRINLIVEAVANGHEMGSHANGHYNGSSWSYQDWSDEFNQFEDFISEIPVPPMRGFRAPLLAINESAYQLLQEKGYFYDASGVASMNTPPWKDKYSIWHFPLVSLRVGNRQSLSMDYNHYMAQTNGVSTVHKGTPEWTQLYNDVYTAYTNYFEYNYTGRRIPLNIGHHFSLWNDGVYYEALLDFAKETCGKPDVVCGTYSELVKMLEENNL
jgi:peptidoglycan/xylan/chitin deacetylase (PgdA/CDA1 family)